jgi:hypothetical protein
MLDSLDDFYRFLMDYRGYKPHEVDQMDIHHLFKLIRKEQKEKQGEKSENVNPRTAKKTYKIDEVPGW